MSLISFCLSCICIPTAESTQNREEDTKKKQEAKRHWQFRSNLVSIVKLFDSIKKRITTAHKAELRKTPFWFLINLILNNNVRGCEKYDKHIVQILDTYNSVEGKFKIESQYVSFTIEDISLIFGIPHGSKILDLKYAKKKESKFIARKFLNITRVSAPEIKE